MANNIKIKTYKTKRKDVAEFKKNAWHEADIELYGAPIDWFEEKRQLVAYDDYGSIVGELSLVITSHVAYVKTVIVKKDVRNKKIGEKLMLEAEKLAKKFDCHKIHLQTGSDWSAISFYEKMGYKKTGEHKNHYFRRDFLIYSKDLK